MNMRWCPYCHQQLRYERAGVMLGPAKASLFDMLKAAGDIGLSSDEIGYQLEREGTGTAGRHNVKSHIWQLRELLEDTDYCIKTDRHHPPHWYLVKRGSATAAA